MADFEISYYGYPYPREIKIWKREFDGGQHFVSVARGGLIVQEWYDSKGELTHSCDLQAKTGFSEPTVIIYNRRGYLDEVNHVPVKSPNRMVGWLAVALLVISVSLLVAWVGVMR